MKKISILFALTAFIIIQAFSQESLVLKIQDVDVDKLTPGDVLTVGVFSESNVGKISGFQLYVEFDREVLTYGKIKHLKEELKNEWMDNESECCYAANWSTLKKAGLALSEGEKLFDIEFTYNGGETDLTWQTEQVISEGMLMQGETLFFNTVEEPIILELKPGCVCKP